ncbi:MAG: R3H domain-containing nucleic acid-binding protein [Candidatus Paceibacterota bacterium]
MTESLDNKIKEVILKMGFKEDQIKITIDQEYNKISINIDDEAVREENTPKVLSAFNHLFNQILKKESKPYHVIDLNYYRKERERLITELARAAAKRASVSGENIELPPMNAYERRLVHVEISTHPELETESIGKGKERRVIVKQLNL